MFKWLRTLFSASKTDPKPAEGTVLDRAGPPVSPAPAPPLLHRTGGRAKLILERWYNLLEEADKTSPAGELELLYYLAHQQLAKPPDYEELSAAIERSNYAARIRRSFQQLCEHRREEYGRLTADDNVARAYLYAYVAPFEHPLQYVGIRKRNRAPQIKEFKSLLARLGLLP